MKTSSTMHTHDRHLLSCSYYYLSCISYWFQEEFHTEHFLTYAGFETQSFFCCVHVAKVLPT
jgi:hypothetical protein